MLQWPQLSETSSLGLLVRSRPSKSKVTGSNPFEGGLVSSVQTLTDGLTCWSIQSYSLSGGLFRSVTPAFLSLSLSLSLVEIVHMVSGNDVKNHPTRKGQDTRDWTSSNRLVTPLLPANCWQMVARQLKLREGRKAWAVAHIVWPD